MGQRQSFGEDYDYGYGYSKDPVIYDSFRDSVR